MTVVAPLYTTCWGMLKQPDNQKSSSRDVRLACGAGEYAVLHQTATRRADFARFGAAQTPAIERDPLDERQIRLFLYGSPSVVVGCRHAIAVRGMATPPEPGWPEYLYPSAR